MICPKPPESFSPRFEVVSCFLENKGEILLLQRRNEKSQGGRWGPPAGKIDAGETAEQALVREIEEETELKIPESSLKFFDKVYVRYPDYDFIYHMYHVELDEWPEVKIHTGEHKGFQWVSPWEALNTKLVDDQDECTRMFIRRAGK